MFCFFFFKQKTAYEMRISDWSSDVCSSDLLFVVRHMSGEGRAAAVDAGAGQAVRQAEAGEVIANPRRVPGGTQAFRCRELVREQIGRASCRERVCQYV